MNTYQSGGISNSIGNLGKALGLGAALLGTPAIYVRTRTSCMTYYTDAVGPSVAKWLTWGTGLLEAYLLYSAASLTVVGLLTWWIAKRAAASFSGE